MKYFYIALLWYIYAVAWSIRWYIEDNPTEPITKQVLVKALTLKILFRNW